ncbi:AMP-binding enzyme, putative [Beauveria bassiana ARSEF 2860]|uniref:AMP-binding enzyme, putative n=1 Tax=Beauveria bassiana (strain ARSEF 2860) TaxID=655819 RepID=J4WKY1_BEAB2|nr:AMP-binding enzyme, putative [Beauveria bassiana ARSEF 2860]EJP70400.1 AMP-binding enzyme, putative [Beauveria bassiana ARSEF 2860]
MLFKSSYPDIHVPTDLTLWQWLFDAPSPAAGCSSSRGDSLPTREYINTTSSNNNNARLTHAQVRDAAAALSAALAHPRRGLHPGDVVAIISPNAVTYPVCFHGVMRAGGVPAVSAPGATETEIRHALRTARARFVMCAPGETLKVVREAARKEGVPEERVFWFADEEEEEEEEEEGGRWCTGLSELVEEGKRVMEEEEEEGMRAVGLPSGKTSAETTAFLCFSSGTTGLPKAVIISHANIIAQCLQLNLAYIHSGIALGLLPFYHISGLVRSLVHCLVSNTSVAVVPRFTMPALLSAISTHRIAEVNLVPPILIRLAHDPTVDDYDLGCVERWATGAAPVSPEVLAQLARRFPGTTGFKQGYGMTETTACVTTHPPHLYGFEHGRSVGTLVAGTVMKVVNEDGVAVGVGERGEIRVKGPQITPGYFDNPAATAAAFDPDGFLRTGDEGSVAPDGQLTIHDRIKEMIKVKGAQVAPAELEDLLLGHPCVADAAVVGVPDDYAGERPFAFVVLRPDGGRGVSAEEVMERLVQHVKDARARDKWLAGVRVVEAIPKSPSGKILRRILRDEYKKSVKVSGAKL